MKPLGLHVPRRVTPPPCVTPCHSASTCHADAQKLRDHLASLLKNMMPKDQIDAWLVELVRGRFYDLAIGPSAPPS